MAETKAAPGAAENPRIDALLSLATATPKLSRKQQMLADLESHSQNFQFFGAGDDEEEDDEDQEVSFVPASANAKDGTVDCVWYGGATVPRRDPNTGDPYMLTLDMAGARLNRLNAGAPIFDSHFSGDDFRSMVAGKMGSKAQIGVVQKAGVDGNKGTATLKFDMGSEDGAEMFRKVSTGIVQNLSFGAWIYAKQKNPGSGDAAEDSGSFTATDWEPFEISCVPVPADFSTQFLSAQPGVTKLAETAKAAIAAAVSAAPPANVTVNLSINGKSAAELLAEAETAKVPVVEKETAGAIGPKKEAPMENTNQVAATEAQLAAVREEATKAEQLRIAEINKVVKLAGFDEKFAGELVQANVSIDKAREQVFAKIEVRGTTDATGKPFIINGYNGGGRDQRDTMRENMEAALLVRYDGNAYKDMREKGREYMGMSLLDMARESLAAQGVNVRGLTKDVIARIALQGGRYGASEYFGGAETTSDLPGILANVANKTLRQAYEAWPQTFRAFSRMVTAPDFKDINRPQLSDAPTLQKLNEKGEYHRAALTDANQNYRLATFGEIVALTRMVIINDDLQAFTRVPALLGVAAAQMESDTAWGIITNNQVMQVDNLALFHATHKNLATGGSSALQFSALSSARASMRVQKAPKGTSLNLVPRFLAAPAALESTVDQLIAPIGIASSDVTKVIPDWIRSLVPIIEPRLDAAGANGPTTWYLFADPAQIDTLEYAYLEGQEGVYIETRQGFDVDGVEIKARMDFGAAALDFRGMQKNVGA